MLRSLEQPWIADLDVTIKPIYGHQEGADPGYNPHKPGRPSHAYQTVFLRTLRVALDVEVRSGKEHACVHGLDNLWRLWDRLTPAQRPRLVCGDANYGTEMIERRGGWQTVRDEWEGCQGELQLTGWTRKRRAVVFRRTLLLFSVARIIKSGRQTTLRITSNHADAAQAQDLLTKLSLFPVTKRLKQYCGSSWTGGALETNLATHFGTLHARPHPQSCCVPAGEKQSTRQPKQGNKKMDAEA